MTAKIEFHPLSKTLAKITIFFILFVCALRLVTHREVAKPSRLQITETHPLKLGTDSELLLPVISLNIPDATLETSWSTALSLVLHGQTEYAVESGRVDVLTDQYAIEVERMPKWHEAIGQASHYALNTSKLPMVALIVSSDDWPISKENREKILLIEKTCLSKSIKLVILRRSAT